MPFLPDVKPYTRNPLMEGFSEYTFKTKDGVDLRVLHKGEGMPFILVHGYSGDADDWMLNAPAFAEKYSVYCLDQRGHGWSVAEHGARISRLGADLNEIIETIGEPKVNLLGWSMGCSVIWSYIDLFGQDRINRVIFDDEPPMLTSNPRFNRKEVLETGSNPMDFWALVNAEEDACYAWGNDSSPFYRAFEASFRRGLVTLTEEMRKEAPDQYYELMAQRPPKNDYIPKKFMAALLKDHLLLDWRDLLPTIQVPVMYLTGDISHATTLELGEWMVKSIPNCRWERFSAEEFGNHDINQVAYKKFNRLVLEFLENRQ